VSLFFSQTYMKAMYPYIVERKEGDRNPYKSTPMPPMRQEKVATKKIIRPF
jgi:hypothetical protein